MPIAGQVMWEHKKLGYRRVSYARSCQLKSWQLSRNSAVRQVLNKSLNVWGGRKGIHPACEKLSGGVLASGVVIFLEQDANLQTYGAGDATALTVSCFSKIQIGTGSPR